MAWTDGRGKSHSKKYRENNVIFPSFSSYVAIYLFLVSLKNFQPMETEGLLKIKMRSIHETSLSSSLY